MLAANSSGDRILWLRVRWAFGSFAADVLLLL
jgi:hypothetical protein